MKESTSVWPRMRLEQQRGPSLSKFRVWNTRNYHTLKKTSLSNYTQTPQEVVIVLCSTIHLNCCCLCQSTEATLTGRNGASVVAPVDKASRKESECATTQNRPMAADPAAAPVSTQGNVTLDSVQVKHNSGCLSASHVDLFCVFL